MKRKSSTCTVQNLIADGVKNLKLSLVSMEKQKIKNILDNFETIGTNLEIELPVEDC